MSEQNAPTRSIRADEVVALADCPYCKRPRGSKCRDRIYRQEVDMPHKSRAAAAFDVRDGGRDIVPLQPHEVANR